YGKEAEGDRERLQQGAANPRTAAGDEHQRMQRRAPHFGRYVFQDAAGRMGTSGDARRLAHADQPRSCRRVEALTRGSRCKGSLINCPLKPPPDAKSPGRPRGLSRSERFSRSSKTKESA